MSKIPWKFKSAGTITEQMQDRLAALPEVPPDFVPSAPARTAGRSSLPSRQGLGVIDAPRCAATTKAGTPCTREALFGTTACLQHTDKNSKVLAQAHLDAMAVPAVKRLEMLAHQNGDLKVSLHAVTQVLNRSLGAVGKDADAAKGPAIRIAIAVGGVPLNIGPAPPAQLPPGPPDEDEDDSVLVVPE